MGLGFGKLGDARSDGHVAYGSHPHSSIMEEVQHIVAAHEIRNSFPLDSLSIRSGNTFDEADHFYEYQFPGAHSDVGGGYWHGEIGKNADNLAKLSQIPLRYMLNFPVNSVVPFIPETAWSDKRKANFAVDDRLQTVFNYYQARLSAQPGNYQWRFQDVNKNNKDAKFCQEKIENNMANSRKRVRT